MDDHPNYIHRIDAGTDRNHRLYTITWINTGGDTWRRRSRKETSRKPASSLSIPPPPPLLPLSRTPGTLSVDRGLPHRTSKRVRWKGNEVERRHSHLSLSLSLAPMASSYDPRGIENGIAPKGTNKEITRHHHHGRTAHNMSSSSLRKKSDLSLVSKVRWGLLRDFLANLQEVFLGTKLFILFPTVPLAVAASYYQFGSVSFYLFSFQKSVGCWCNPC